MKKRIITVTAVAAAAAMLLSGCGASGGDKSASDSSSNNIISVFASEPQNPLIPGNTNESGGGKVIRLLYSQLVWFNPEGEASNDQADSIKANADGTQYTIKIKKGLKFSDGSPITAKSYTRAWSYIANAKNAQKNSSFFSSIKGYKDLQDKNLKGDEQLSGLKDVDDTTFTVDLDKPDATFPIKVGYSAFSPLADSFYKDPKAFGQNPVGNGPYKFKKWDHNTSIEVVKNPNYKGPESVKNDGVTFKIYTKDDAAYADVQAGNLDVMDTVPAADTKTFEKDSSVVAYNKPGSVIQQFTIPSNLEHFKAGTEEGTLRRQAISMGIDRKGLVDKVLNGVGTPADDFTSPLTPGYVSGLKGSENVKYNPKKAKELWDKADAISKFDGKFSLSYNADGGNKPIYDAMANSINNALGKDVVVSTAVPTFQEFRDAVSKRQMTGGFRAGWMPDYPSAENYLYQNFDSAAADGNGSNDGDYKNAEFDKLMDEAYQAKSVDDANKLYSQSQEILLNDLPAVPMYYKNNDGVAAKGVKGFAIDWQSYPTYSQITKK